MVSAEPLLGVRAVPFSNGQYSGRGLNSDEVLSLSSSRLLLFSITIDILPHVADTAILLKAFRNNPKGVRFADLAKVCDAYFGEPRQKGTSHRIYRTPRPDDPRVNIQNVKGMAKPYQVRQVLKAIEKLEGMK